MDAPTGMELLLKKSYGKLTGWLGYTLSWSQNKINGINNGKWYNASNDRRHDVSIVLMYDLPRHWDISALWMFNTGQAYSAPSVKYTIGGETFYYYSERNGYRMNDYHRLDISVSHQFSVKDIPNESTFFRYRIYRNGELYKWTVFRDKGYENMNVVVNVVCMSEEQMKKDDPDDDDVLHDGDEIHLEVETINRRTYDYLHILKSMSNSGANPVSMFDGALGYLAVYVPVKYDCVFQKSDISGQ